MRVIYAVFILLLVLMTSAQCQQTAEDWLNKGHALYDQANYSDAIKAFDEAIRLDPNDNVAWNNKGAALAHQGNYSDAIRAYDEAIRLDPNLAAAWRNKGDALAHQGNYSDAIKAFDEAIRLDPNYALAWSNKGDALAHQGNYSDAIRAYDEAIRLDPNLAAAWRNKGVAIARKGDYYDTLDNYGNPCFSMSEGDIRIASWSAFYMNCTSCKRDIFRSNACSNRKNVLNIPTSGAKLCYELSLDKDFNNTYMLIRYSQNYETVGGENLIQVYLDNEKLPDTEVTKNTDDWNNFTVLPPIFLGNLTSGQHKICLSIAENDWGIDIDMVGIFSTKTPINMLPSPQRPRTGV